MYYTLTRVKGDGDSIPINFRLVFYSHSFLLLCCSFSPLRVVLGDIKLWKVKGKELGRKGIEGFLYKSPFSLLINYTVSQFAEFFKVSY